MSLESIGKVVLIGAGNLATHLGQALVANGVQVAQVFSRTRQSADTLAALLHCPAVTSLDEVVTDAQVYIFSVKDAVLAQLIAQLVPRVPQALCLHTAGSMPLGLFQGYAAHYGVLYPMQTFSRNRPVDFRRIPVFIEGNDAETLATICQLAERVSDRVQRVDSEQRRRLHLAAVFACNFVNHCYALCDELLKEQGLTFDCMESLIDETAAKVHQLPPRLAQTGPAVRYDRNVMDTQLQLLEGHPQWQEIYHLMSESIHQLSHD